MNRGVGAGGYLIAEGVVGLAGEGVVRLPGGTWAGKLGTGLLLIIGYLFDTYYTSSERGRQGELFCHRGHREEEIRNTKHDPPERRRTRIRNNIKTRMLEWPKREGTRDDGVGCIVLDTSQNLQWGWWDDECEEIYVGDPGGCCAWEVWCARAFCRGSAIVDSCASAI